MFVQSIPNERSVGVVIITNLGAGLIDQLIRQGVSTVVSGNPLLSGGGSAPQRNDEKETELSKDTIYFLLKNQRRRAVIEYLLEEGGSARFDDLVMGIATREKDKGIDEITYKERKSVHTALYQSHLPKLQEAGVVEYDRPSGSVSLTETIESVRPYLEADEPVDRPSSGRQDAWRRSYLGLLMVLVVAALLQASGTYRFTPLSLSGVAISIGFVVAALTAWIERTRK